MVAAILKNPDRGQRYKMETRSGHICPAGIGGGGGGGDTARARYSQAPRVTRWNN